MLGQFLILAVAGFLIMNGQIGIGVVMSVGNLSGTVTNYSKSVANSLILLNATGKLLEKYGKITDESKVTDGEEVTAFESKLELKNLAVAFPDGQKIEYPEIVIEKVKKYAIIGDSGSGKSTLINLLVGNKQDYEGEILLDGKDYKGINRKSLPHVMSVIMQFPYFFKGTVEENLTLGRKISPDIFDKSIRIACADDFVFNKLDTVYDKNLSGGQQERLSVARELMGSKPILVMDESTASVDKKTALAVEKNILEISNSLKNILPEEYTYLSRWISLKIIDYDDTIIQNINNKIFKANAINVNSLKSSNENIKNTIVSSIVKQCEHVGKKVTTFTRNSKNTDRKIDKILTSKTFGIPIMLLFLGIIFWITIIGANYPSQLLSTFFNFLQDKLIILFNNLNVPSFITNPLIYGVYQTTTWVISVMLPPMAIFFPIFTLLEDLGFLPRIAFNLDKCFKRCCTCGKQALTMCMGFGCNAAGVVGCRIIDSKREKIIAMLTNCFVPCNGRFPFLITIATIFVGGLFSGVFSSLVATATVLFIVLLGIFMTIIVSKFLSKTLLKGKPTSFILELPPYRKPQMGKVIVRSIFDRTIFVLGRALAVAAPAGLIIWLLANLHIGDITLLSFVANILDPFARLMGLDGYILTAFILGLPANEIVLPIILMSYLGDSALVNLEDTFSIGNILVQHGWTFITAINVMIFCLLHFPCSTTLISIKKESRKLKMVHTWFRNSNCLWNSFMCVY